MNNKIKIFCIVLTGILAISLVGQYNKTYAEEVPYVEMLRLYNPNSGEHFYTGSVAEKNTLVSVGWQYEGIGWRAPKSGTPVYRLYNPNAGDHHYTTSASEKNNLVNTGWNYEGVAWYSEEGGEPLYRLYNPNALSGSHHYTMSTSERDSLVSLGWQYEGVGWYAVKNHTHSWVHHDAEYKTVHHDAEYKTVHHDAEYKTVHHDAEYKTVHHDAESTTVHHDAVYVSEGLRQTETEHSGTRWDCYCRNCHTGFNNEDIAIHSHHSYQSPGPIIEMGYTEISQYRLLKLSQESFDEVVQTQAAYDEQVQTRAAYDEHVLVKAAYDEQVLVKAAYDEQVLVKEAYDSCSCGAAR